MLEYLCQRRLLAGSICIERAGSGRQVLRDVRRAQVPGDLKLLGDVNINGHFERLVLGAGYLAKTKIWNKANCEARKEDGTRQCYTQQIALFRKLLRKTCLYRESVFFHDITALHMMLRNVKQHQFIFTLGS